MGVAILLAIYQDCRIYWSRSNIRDTQCAHEGKSHNRNFSNDYGSSATAKNANSRSIVSIRNNDYDAASHNWGDTRVYSLIDLQCPDYRRAVHRAANGAWFCINDGSSEWSSSARGWSILHGYRDNYISYINWILQTLPDGIIKNNQLAYLNIHFKQEALAGDNIISLTERMEIKDDSIGFIHSIAGKDKKAEFVQAITIWKTI